MELYHDLLESVNREYDIVKCLKSSDRGSVFVVRHKQSRKRYVFRHYDGNASVYRNLLSVSCPHLPQIMEAAEWDGKAAVLEEYVQGDTLYFLLEGGTLDWKTGKKIMLQLCQALAVLHSMGAVHRDIKPENIIIRGDEAVLIDFDASRIVKLEQDTDTMVLGTVGFAAPEQFGLTQSDERADIYSMGVLLNLILTGQHPSRKLASGRFGQIVQRCTMMNPQKRYKTIMRLMKVL